MMRLIDWGGSVPWTGRVLIGAIVLVRKRTCDGAYFFVTAAPCAMRYFFNASAQRSALERVIVEHWSSRRIYDEPTE